MIMWNSILMKPRRKVLAIMKLESLAEVGPLGALSDGPKFSDQNVKFSTCQSRILQG